MKDMIFKKYLVSFILCLIFIFYFCNCSIDSSRKFKYNTINNPNEEKPKEPTTIESPTLENSSVCPYEGEDEARACINGKYISHASRVSWFDFSNVSEQDLEISYFRFNNYNITNKSILQKFILSKKSNFRLDITNTYLTDIDIIIFIIKNNLTKELLLYQVGDNYLYVPSWFFFIRLLNYKSQEELDLFNENYIFGDNVQKFVDEVEQKYIAYRKVELTNPILQNNSLSIPRKFWLNNNWSTGAIKVELVEKDFDFQSATIGQALSWKTFSTITTTIATWSNAIIYQTRVDYTGPLYYKIFDANTNSLLLESVIRGYPLINELDFPKLNWQKRLITTQVKSVYYPYEYEYFTSFQ